MHNKVHDSRGRSPPYQLDSQGRLVLADTQVGDERDYVCVVTVGAVDTAEATTRLLLFGECLGLLERKNLGVGGQEAREGTPDNTISPPHPSATAKPEATQVSPNTGTLSVTEDIPQEVLGFGAGAPSGPSGTLSPGVLEQKGTRL